VPAVPLVPAEVPLVPPVPSFVPLFESAGEQLSEVSAAVKKPETMRDRYPRHAVILDAE
jgi:hypothetical protein